MKLHDTDIRLLRVFDAIVRAGSFSAAQSVLNISASTISEHMTRLETRLGLKLCERGRSGFKLTLAGQHTYQACQQLFDSIDCFKDKMSEFHQDLRGDLHIGMIDNTISNQQMPVIDGLRQLLQRSDAIVPNIKIGTPYQLEQDVLNRKLHLAIGPFQQHIPGLEYRALYVEQHCLYCSNLHPFFEYETVTPAMLTQAAVVSRMYLFGRDLAILDVEQAAAIIDNIEAQATLIHTGHYIGFLPQHYAQHWLEQKLLKQIFPYQLSSQFYCITKAAIELSSLTQAFLTILNQHSLND